MFFLIVKLYNVPVCLSAATFYVHFLNRSFLRMDTTIFMKISCLKKGLYINAWKLWCFLLPQSSSCVSCLTLFHPSRHPVDQPLLRCLSPLPFALVYEPSLIYFLSAFINQVCQKVLYGDQRTTNTDKKKAKAKDKSKKVRAHQK